MATFQAQVTALTTITISSSSTYPTEAQLTQFLTDGAKEVIGILPPKLKMKCSTISILNATNGTTLDMDDKGEILAITRLSANSSGYYIPCREIEGMYGDLANDSTDLINYATVTDPVFWVISNSSDISTLFVKPTTTDAQPANAYHISYPSVLYSASDIANFPDSAEHLVVLYASLKSLLSAIGALEIPPNVAVENADSASLTSDLADTGSGFQIGTDDNFEDFNTWFIALGEMIEDDEDIELAGAQIEKINLYVNTWNIQLQGNMAEMQQYMQLYQTLKADYVMGIQMLQSGGLPQPQQAQPQRARR